MSSMPPKRSSPPPPGTCPPILFCPGMCHQVIRSMGCAGIPPLMMLFVAPGEPIARAKSWTIIRRDQASGPRPEPYPDTTHKGYKEPLGQHTEPMQIFCGRIEPWPGTARVSVPRSRRSAYSSTSLRPQINGGSALAGTNSNCSSSPARMPASRRTMPRSAPPASRTMSNSLRTSRP